MGTNYYLHSEKCQCCGRSDEPLHIGKSSAGWHFALHVMPEQNINTLNDWVDLWSKPGAVIENEYGATVTPEEMLKTITERGRDEKWGTTPHGYTSWAQFHRDNYSEQGLNGLLAHKHRARRSEGTYDYCEGEFS